MYNVGSHIQIFFASYLCKWWTRGSILPVVGSLLSMGRQYISPKSCTYKSLFFLMGFLLLFVFRWILAEGASAVRSKTPHLRLENFMDHFLIGDPLQFGVCAKHALLVELF